MKKEIALTNKQEENIEKINNLSTMLLESVNGIISIIIRTIILFGSLASTIILYELFGKKYISMLLLEGLILKIVLITFVVILLLWVFVVDSGVILKLKYKSENKIKEMLRQRKNELADEIIKRLEKKKVKNK